MVNKQKQEEVRHIEELIQSDSNIFFVDFTGIDANNTVEFRRKIRHLGASYKVYKNRLFKVAAAKCSFPAEIEEFTNQTTGFIFVGEDVTGVSKTLKEWANTFKTFKIKGGYYNNSILHENDILELAKIPSKNELIGKLLYLLNSPLTRLVGVLKANQRDLVSVVKQISKKNNGRI
jgi:large subunit ribosomal protein L10